jgi:hypothetical protein
MRRLPAQLEALHTVLRALDGGDTRDGRALSSGLYSLAVTTSVVAIALERLVYESSTAREFPGRRWSPL